MGMQGGETTAAQYPLACLEDIPISRLPALVKAHDKLGAALNGAVAKVVESCGGVVSGSLQRASPALARRWRPRHGAE